MNEEVTLFLKQTLASMAEPTKKMIRTAYEQRFGAGSFTSDTMDTALEIFQQMKAEEEEKGRQPKQQSSSRSNESSKRQESESCAYSSDEDSPTIKRKKSNKEEGTKEKKKEKKSSTKNVAMKRSGSAKENQPSHEVDEELARLKEIAKKLGLRFRIFFVH
jgi:hypothetical protein